MFLYLKTAYAMRKLIFILLIIISTFQVYSQCTWQICLGDTYGDGWTGNSIDVSVNGTLIYDDLTLSSGYGPECHNISVNYGETIQITADASGSWPNDCYFYLYDGNGDRIIYTFINNAPVSYTVNATDCATERINGDCGSHNITVCSTENINSNSVGSGNYWELTSSNDGCLGGENYSTWIYFHAETAGQIGFTITPNNEDGGANDDDYDFAVWETTTCPPTTNPIRCSWAVAGDQSSYSGCSNRNIGYVTGIGTPNMLDTVDNSEDHCGDGWVDYINATAGQEFTLMIDNYSSTTNSFTLSWDLPGGATLDCNPLPVNYTSMEYDCNLQKLKWQTLSEINNNYFTIETGTSFDSNGNLIIEDVYVVNGSGTTNFITDYEYNIDLSNKYIRLSQVDYNGITTELETKYYTCDENIEPTIRLMPNPATANSIVKIDGEYIKAEIYDMLGKKVNIEITNNQIIGLSKGVYFIKLDDNKPIKLIIQ